MVGFVPIEFARFQGEGNVETVFLCDRSMVPETIPDNSLFLAKENAKFQDFTQLMCFFDDSFKEENLNVVVFCLGCNDVSHADKQLNFNAKLQTLDFHTTKNSRMPYVEQCFTSLVETIVEFKNVTKVVTFDIMSRESSGHHNAGVEYLNRRVTKISDKHSHFHTWKRYQRDFRKKARKEKITINFPLNGDRFEDDGSLKNEEKQILTTAALSAMTCDGDLLVGDARFARKF